MLSLRGTEADGARTHRPIPASQRRPRLSSPTVAASNSQHESNLAERPRGERLCSVRLTTRRSPVLCRQPTLGGATPWATRLVSPERDDYGRASLQRLLAQLMRRLVERMEASGDKPNPSGDRTLGTRLVAGSPILGDHPPLVHVASISRLGPVTWGNDPQTADDFYESLNHRAVGLPWAPSTGISAPFTQRARSETTNAITSATSWSVPRRPSGRSLLRNAAKLSGLLC